MEEEKKKTNFFTDENGVLSMRRLLAFIFALASIGLGIMCLILKLDWKVNLVAAGLPLGGALLMMFFTSWSDIASVASAVKK